MTTTTDALIAELRHWTANHDDHVRAAVELLIEHDYWLRNGYFVRVAVENASDGRYIIWRKAREAFDDGTFDRSSTSERAILDLAIALGEDRYGLNKMGDWHRKLMADKFADAAGVKR